MKIIKVEGCAGCPHSFPKAFMGRDDEPIGCCLKTMQRLAMVWSVNPYYLLPDCPLEDEK